MNISGTDNWIDIELNPTLGQFYELCGIGLQNISYGYFQRFDVLRYVIWNLNLKFEFEIWFMWPKGVLWCFEMWFGNYPEPLSLFIGR